MRKLIYIAFALWSFWTNRSHAAEVRWVPVGTGDAAIVFSGPIRHNDYSRLDAALRDIWAHGRTATVVRLNSPGGYIDDGYEVAGGVRALDLDTEVTDGAECASACFMIFASGKNRSVAYGGRVGVHSVSTGGRTDEGSDASTTQMARYLRKLGVPAQITGRMVTTMPEDMAWLTPEELRSMGARVIVPPAPEPAPRPLAFAPKPAPDAKPAADAPVASRYLYAKPAPAKPKASED